MRKNRKKKTVSKSMSNTLVFMVIFELLLMWGYLLSTGYVDTDTQKFRWIGNIIFMSLASLLVMKWLSDGAKWYEDNYRKAIKKARNRGCRIEAIKKILDSDERGIKQKWEGAVINNIVFRVDNAKYTFQIPSDGINIGTLRLVLKDELDELMEQEIKFPDEPKYYAFWRKYFMLPKMQTA